MTQVLFNGCLVATMRTNNTKGSATCGYVGQDLGNGDFAVYVPSLGICTVEMDAEPEKVHIQKILLERAKIRDSLLKAFSKNKKLSFLYEVGKGENVVIQFVELGVNSETVETLLDNLCLNTQKGKRTGVCLRDVGDAFQNLASVGTLVRQYSAVDLITLHEVWQDGQNNGNFGEFLVGRNIRSLTHRFDPKVNDVIYDDGIHKAKRRAELKTSLKSICKAAKAGASNTNQLVYINLK